MKLALLASSLCIHSVRWANEMALRGHEVHLLSLDPVSEALCKEVRIHPLWFPRPHGYFLNVPQVRLLLHKIEPDVVHAHYASGYGTLARLTERHPWVISVWGSDVYEFPEKHAWKRRLITKNLAAADWICSTSHVMARRVRDLFPSAHHVTVVPFGVDLEVFAPLKRPHSPNFITIGTVKTLAPQYGIDLLLRAFASLRESLRVGSPSMVSRLRLRLVGDGPSRKQLTALAATLGIRDVTEFSGSVPHSKVPSLLASLDVFSAPSRGHESFGVAVVEASACGLPVVVTDVGGLPEVVKADETGFVTPSEDVAALTDALRRLVTDPQLRERMGHAGREHVRANYQWGDNADTMESVYENLLAKKA